MMKERTNGRCEPHRELGEYGENTTRQTEEVGVETGNNNSIPINEVKVRTKTKPRVPKARVPITRAPKVRALKAKTPRATPRVKAWRKAPQMTAPLFTYIVPAQ
jgi:hypothetical protein